MAEEIKAPGFSPVANPVSTVARPAEHVAGPAPIAPMRPQAPTPIAMDTVENSSGYRLGRALSEIAPKIGQWMVDDYNSKLKEQSDAYGNKFATMDVSEAQAFYDEESKKVSSAALKALNKTYGIRRAYADMQSIKEGIDNGKINLTTTSFDDVLNPYMEQMGEDVDYREGYENVVAELAPKFRAAESEYRTETFLAGRNEAIHGAILDMVAYAGETGEDPHEAVRKLYAAFGPGSDFNLENREIDALVVEAAASLATQGKLNEVKSLLESERKGVNGETIPPIGRSRQYAAKVASIIKVATSENEEGARDHYNRIELDARTAASNGSFENWEAQNISAAEDYEKYFGKSYPSVVDSLRQESKRVQAVYVKQNAIDATRNGAERQLQRDSANLMAVYRTDPNKAFEINLRLADLPAKVQVPGYPDEEIKLPDAEAKQQTFWEAVINDQVRGIDPSDPQADAKMMNRATAPLINAGYVYKPWQEEMSTSPLAISSEDIKKGEIPDHMIQSHMKWSAFRAQGGGPLANKYAGEQAWFYEAVDLLPANISLEKRMALVLQAKEASRGKPPAELEKAFNTEVSDLNIKMFTSSDGKSLAGADNVMSMAPKYHSYYKALREVGTSKDQALKATQKLWNENVVTVNNHAYDISNIQIPGNELPKVIEFIGKKVSEQYSGVGDADEFYMMQNREGNLFIPSFKGAGLMSFDPDQMVELRLGSKTVKLPLTGWTPADLQKIRQAAAYEAQTNIKLDKNTAQPTVLPGGMVMDKYLGIDNEPAPNEEKPEKTSFSLISPANAAPSPEPAPESRTKTVETLQPVVATLVSKGVNPKTISKTITDYYDGLGEDELASPKKLQSLLENLPA